MITKKAIQKIADKIHRDLKLSFPVDLDYVCKKLGLIVRHEEIEDSVSGMIACHQDKGIIAVNKNHVETRQRFTIAHEIGHFRLHSSSFIDKHYRRSDENDRLSLSSPEEVQANYFAASLLMPQSEIERLLDEWDIWQFYDDELEALAKYFNVSIVAMTVRLKSLGHIPDGLVV